MTASDYLAVMAPQFVSGCAYYTERLDADAPHSDRGAADKAAQAEALRRVRTELQHAAAPYDPAAVMIVERVARELGVEL